MILTGDMIFITFDENDRYKRIGGVPGLMMPDRWEALDEYGFKTGKMDENLNYLETKPQVGYVLVANPNFPYKVGDRIFMHYLAYSQGVQVELFGYVGRVIPATDIFFTDNDEEGIVMSHGTYLGKQEMGTIEQTPSGIYLGHIEEIKTCYIRITHAYEGAPYVVGDTIFTIDGAQYPIKYGGEPFVKVLEDEIVGSLV